MKNASLKVWFMAAAIPVGFVSLSFSHAVGSTQSSPGGKGDPFSESPSGSKQGKGAAATPPSAPAAPAAGTPAPPTPPAAPSKGAKSAPVASGQNNIPIQLGPPSAVKEASDRFFGDSTSEIHKEIQEGQTWWTATGSKDGQQTAIRMTERGDITQSQIQITPTDLSAAIQALIKQTSPNARIQRAVTVQTTYYDITYSVDGRTRHAKVYANGQPVPSGSEVREASADPR